MLNINSVAGEENKFWFTTKELSALFEYNCDSGSVRVLSMLGKTLFDDNNEYGVIKKYRNKIYISPMRGDFFCIYNIETNELRKEVLFERESKCFRIRSVVQYSDIICYVGCDLKILIRVDCSTDKITIVNLSEKVDSDSGKCMISDSNSEKIVLCYEKSNKILEYNMITNKLIAQDIRQNTTIYGSCVAGNYELFFSSNDEQIWYSATIDDRQNSVSLPEGYIGTDRNYAMALSLSHSLWVMPFKGNMILEFDESRKKMKCVKKYDNDKRIVFLHAGKLNEDMIWGFNCQDNTIDIINTIDKTIKKYEIGMIEGICEILQKTGITNQILSEMQDNGIGLELFMNCI